MTEDQNNTPITQAEISQLDSDTQVSDNTSHTDQGSVLKPLNLQVKGQSDMKSANKLAILIMVVAVIAGIGTGFGLNKISSNSPSKSSSAPISVVPSNGINAGDVFGSPNEDAFKDTATGYLEKGGMDGDGSHKLLRAGGDSQTVYLTSSITDLDEFIGMDIQIWGETFKAQNAGWLMDVGRVKVIDTQASAPVEE